MNTVELYVARANNDRLQLWIDCVETLKRAVIKSLGRVIRQIIKDKKVRFQQMSVSEILARVRAKYGRMQKDTNLSLKERMLTLLPTLDGLESHISNLEDMFEVSETAGFPITEYRKVEIFRESVCAQPLIGKLLETFDVEFPDAHAVSYEQISAYLEMHLLNLKHSQMTATRASANLVALNAYATLEAESKRLQAENENLNANIPIPIPKSHRKAKSNKEKERDQVRERANVLLPLSPRLKISNTAMVMAISAVIPQLSAKCSLEIRLSSIPPCVLRLHRNTHLQAQLKLMDKLFLWTNRKRSLPIWLAKRNNMKAKTTTTMTQLPFYRVL